MANNPHPISTAFWTFVIPMVATRAMRIGLVLFVAILAVVVLLFVSGLLATGFVTGALYGMRHFVIMVALPAAAILLSEIPIRDGITHRTLLYPLLGPVPRITLAVVRVLVTGAVLAVAAGALLLIIRLLLGDGLGFLPRELLAVTLGAFVYVSLFGLIHLYSRRGLIAGVAVFFFFDLPLGRLPFSLRNISLSYHVGVIAQQEESMQLPIMFGVPESSVVVSVLILLGAAVAFCSAVALGFNRKSLGDIC
ncbi:MAG: hypothetical protein PVF33_06090 [Candidatus Latescibacterota bacterium]|jgi:hypothetical protein